MYVCIIIIKLTGHVIVAVHVVAPAAHDIAKFGLGTFVGTA